MDTKLEELCATDLHLRGELALAKQRLDDHTRQFLHYLVENAHYECLSINWGKVNRIKEHLLKMSN